MYIILIDRWILLTQVNFENYLPGIMCTILLLLTISADGGLCNSTNVGLGWQYTIELHISACFSLVQICWDWSFVTGDITSASLLLIAWRFLCSRRIDLDDEINCFLCNSCPLNFCRVARLKFGVETTGMTTNTLTQTPTTIERIAADFMMMMMASYWWMAIRNISS